MIEKLGVSLSYSRDQIDQLFEYAKANDVSLSGVYDARLGAINVWSHDFSNKESSLIASFYFKRDNPKLWQIEVHPPYDMHKAVSEYKRFELEALGKIVNSGRIRP